MFNTITAAGHLVKDPETREVGDKKVCKMRLCISGNRVQDKEKLFIDVEFWNRQAEIAQEYLKKGRSIIVQGELRRNTWEKEGKEYQKDFISGQSFQFLNTGGSDGNKESSEPSKETEKVSAPVDEDIPF